MAAPKQLDMPRSEVGHAVKRSRSPARSSATFPSALMSCATRFMTLSISPPAKPLLTSAILFLAPPAAWRALAKDRTGWGVPTPKTEGGMKRLRTKARKPVKIMGRRKQRSGVEKACRKSTIRIFFFTSVHVWRKKSIASGHCVTKKVSTLDIRGSLRADPPANTWLSSSQISIILLPERYIYNCTQQNEKWPFKFQLHTKRRNHREAGRHQAPVFYFQRQQGQGGVDGSSLHANVRISWGSQACQAKPR